jgi:CRP-like cAMP-binding protein
MTLFPLYNHLLRTPFASREDVNARIPRRDKARRDTRDLEVFLASFERSYGGGARTLAAPEVAAITAFLSVNVPEFAALGRSDAALKGLIRSAELVERTDEPSSPGLHGGGDVAPQETALLPQSRDSSVPQSPRSGGHAGNVWDAARWQADEELRLYAQGEPSDRFTLVLQGRVLVHTSAEGFSFELGPWSVLGNRALSDLRFVADFDAVAVPPCRLLRVKRESYKAALRAASYDAIVGSHSLRQELRRDRARSAGPGTFDGIELSSIPEVQSWTELSPREHVTIDVQSEAAKKSDDDKDDEASKRP